MDYEVRNNLLESENQLYKSELKARLDKIKELEEENRKLKAHCNMLESENRLLKEECKARLEKIEELEKNYDRLKVAFGDVVSGF